MCKLHCNAQCSSPFKDIDGPTRQPTESLRRDSLSPFSGRFLLSRSFYLCPFSISAFVANLVNSTWEEFSQRPLFLEGEKIEYFEGKTDIRK